MRKLLLIGGIYACVIVISIAFIVYFNLYREEYLLKDNIEVINIVFIIVAAISGKLFISEIMDYRREMKSSQKRVVEAKILERKNYEITLGNKSFEEEDFLFRAPEFDSLKEGDTVRVELSAVSSKLFSVKRI